MPSAPPFFFSLDGIGEGMSVAAVERIIPPPSQERAILPGKLKGSSPPRILIPRAAGKKSWPPPTILRCR
ncbi:hypothetical protein GCM10019071_13640 [Sphingobium fuliginis]|uniref:Uncharacterized protein n=1 Tax=Sphingobium fuliginis (strain ATCC 27551) TaxID=336203 RepID=A0ABQ1EU54_SPHSA|nr:hypothetical protein GCM10019071_13640 [Sphingobium fuliginis]